MKKVLLLTDLILIVFLLTGCGIFNLNGWLTPDDIEFMQVVENLKTPQEISDYMMKNFTYELHALYAPDPYTLWKTGRGDCNDMSTWVQYIGNYHGWETWQIRISYLNDPFWQHCIAVYREDNLYNFFDNQYYFPINATSFREIVEYDCYYLTNKIWTKFIVYNYSGEIVSSEVNK